MTQARTGSAPARLAGFLQGIGPLYFDPGKNVFVHMLEKTRYFALTALSALGLGACARGLLVPAMDATPPTAILDVAGPDQDYVLTSGGDPAEVELGPGDSLVLVAVGEDGDGGVRDITLRGLITVKCRNEETGRQWVRKASFLRYSVRKAVPGEPAEGSRTARFTVRPPELRRLCAGGDLQSAQGQAAVRTMNFHGGSSFSPVVEFRLSDSLNILRADSSAGARKSVPGPEKARGKGADPAPRSALSLTNG